MKSKLLIIRKQSGSRNLLPNDFEESPLMFQVVWHIGIFISKENLLNILVNRSISLLRTRGKSRSISVYKSN